MLEMNDTPRLRRVKAGYTTGARTLASRSVSGLARTRVTPNVLTATGVSLCLAAAVLVPFENRDRLLFYWVAAAVFVVGSVLDILDGALATAGLDRVTVSLDSLDDAAFRAMNDVDFPVQRVLEGIEAAAAAGLPVKVNAVVKRGVNDGDLLALA
ncbi:MAG TPA: radical SAM protein, partial [Gaiellaceae bacterium]|nr:radical SAM protein [Gaiellaceae bacterium]